MGITPAECIGTLARTGAKQRTARIVLGNIDATSEGDVAIDHQYLAMVAVIQSPGADPTHRIDWIEFDQLDASHAHAVEERPRCLQRANAVIKDIDLYPGELLCNQQVGKLQAECILVKNIGFQIDVVASATDCCQHCAHCLGAVEQQGGTVAINQWAAGCCFFHCRQFGNIVAGTAHTPLQQGACAFCRQVADAVFDGRCIAGFLPRRQGTNVW